jgi:hypothetical protein
LKSKAFSIVSVVRLANKIGVNQLNADLQSRTNRKGIAWFMETPGSSEVFLHGYPMVVLPSPLCSSLIGPDFVESGWLRAEISSLPFCV